MGDSVVRHCPVLRVLDLGTSDPTSPEPTVNVACSSAHGKGSLVPTAAAEPPTAGTAEGSVSDPSSSAGASR